MKKYKPYLFFLPFYISLLIGFYFNEDNLGKASFDALYHFDMSKKFNENFFETFVLFGSDNPDYVTRNSPIFWIFLSFVNKFLDYEIIRLLHTLSLFLIAITFYKCLELKFKTTNNSYLLVLSSIIFLSPTLRSLAIWPYTLLWGLYFFILSIYYYLKFKENINFSNSLKILIPVIVSSYIYPSFAVFLYFTYLRFYSRNRDIVLIVKILFISFLLSLPCLYYIFSEIF